jgi:hypothetical protein
MDIINQLQALRQELCEQTNKQPYGNERGRERDRAITAIDNLIEALERLNNLE